MLKKVNMKKYVEDSIEKVFKEKGSRGLSLNEILEYALISKEDFCVNTMMPTVYKKLDSLLEEGYITFDVEQDIWRNA